MLNALNYKENRIESAFYTGARNSGKLLVQFNNDHLPYSIKPAHYINAGDELDVNLSLMRPVRCNKCQRHGHKTAKCRSTRPICAYCSYPDHTYDQCKDRLNKYRNGKSYTPPNCAACFEARLPYKGHQVTSRTCPVCLKYEQSVIGKNNRSIAAREAERAIHKEKVRAQANKPRPIPSQQQTQNVASTGPHNQEQTPTPTQEQTITVSIDQLAEMATQLDEYFGSKIPNHDSGALSRIIFGALMKKTTEVLMDQDPPIDAHTNDATLTNDANVTSDVINDVNVIIDVIDVETCNDATANVSHKWTRKCHPRGRNSPPNSNSGSPNNAQYSAVCQGRYIGLTQKAPAPERPESPETSIGDPINCMGENRQVSITEIQRTTEHDHMNRNKEQEQRKHHNKKIN